MEGGFPGTVSGCHSLALGTKLRRKPAPHQPSSHSAALEGQGALKTQMRVWILGNRKQVSAQIPLLLIPG